MAVSVTMPALGESVTEGTVTRWLKKEGERIEVDEPLLEVSTDKVDTEIPSPAAGVLESIKVQEDETVEVGVELAVIGDGEAAGRDTASAAPAAVEPTPEVAAAPAPAPTAAPAPAPAAAPAPAPAAVPAPAAPAPVAPDPALFVGNQFDHEFGVVGRRHPHAGHPALQHRKAGAALFGALGVEVGTELIQRPELEPLQVLFRHHLARAGLRDEADVVAIAVRDLQDAEVGFASRWLPGAPQA